MNPTGTCALCKSPNVTLIDSHVVSKWCYRRIVGYDPAAAPNPVAVEDGRAGYSSRQVTEYLLCKPCEDRLGVREDYVSRVALQRDSTTFPALAQAQPMPGAPGVDLVDVRALDVDKLTYFASSVFWRADLAQIDPIVDLGASREDLRGYLLGHVAFSACHNVVLTLVKPPPGVPRVDRLVAFPATSDAPSGVHDRHDFLACGMRFTLFTGSSTPPPADEVSLPRKGLAFVSDGRSILSAVAEEAQTSTMYGKLAGK